MCGNDCLLPCRIRIQACSSAGHVDDVTRLPNPHARRPKRHCPNPVSLQAPCFQADLLPPELTINSLQTCDSQALAAPEDGPAQLQMQHFARGRSGNTENHGSQQAHTLPCNVTPPDNMLHAPNSQHQADNTQGGEYACISSGLQSSGGITATVVAESTRPDCVRRVGS